MNQTNNAIIPIDFGNGAASEMLDLWRMTIGELTPKVRAIITSYTENQWLTDWDVRYAIEETAMAPKPSLRYCVAILRRIERDKMESAQRRDNV